MGIAAGLGGALAIGLGALLLHQAEGRQHVGPTSATLDEAFSAILGQGLGLLVGSGLGAMLARRSSRLLSGLLAGAIAYALIVVPYTVLRNAGDFGLGEELSFIAAFFPLVLGPFVIVGAVAGSMGDAVSEWLSRRSSTPS